MSIFSLEISLDIFIETDRKNIYFEYYNTQKICIAIYPTPEACRPKKTELGKTDIVIDALQASTTYSIVYKKDNTIRCIMAPCPTNDFTSLALEFTTKPKQEGDVTYITKNLFYGLRDQQVVLLQKVLIRDGYLFSQATGYFGRLTLAAVMKFQSDNDVPRTGYVGPITRKVLYTMMHTDASVSSGVHFEGTITAFSTACFTDAVCSITVDNKKIITTIGRSQVVLGEVRGVTDLSAVAGKIGSHAKVYAKKTADGYTLYGSKDYYIEIQ